MLGKLGALLIVTAALVLVSIPVRTHAVLFDPSKPPRRPSLGDIVGSMYLTPGTGLLIAAILAIATFAAVMVIRGQW